MALFKEYIDVIEEKKKELVKLQEESNDALDLVTRTINNLSTVNEKIDVVVSELQEAASKIQDTETQLAAQKSKNFRIITKFKNLIDAE